MATLASPPHAVVAAPPQSFPGTGAGATFYPLLSRTAGGGGKRANKELTLAGRRP